MKKLLPILIICFVSCKPQLYPIHPTKKPEKQNSGTYGFLNINGKVVIEPIFDYCSSFNGNYADIGIDSVYGYVNIKGKYKLFPQYDSVSWNSWDPTNIGHAEKNGKYALIHRNGKLVTDFIFDDVSYKNDGFISVKLNGHWNFADKNGNIVFQNENIILSSYPIIDSVAIILDYPNIYEGKQGVVNVQGKIIVPPIYDGVYGFFQNNSMIVMLNDKLGLINRNGEEIIPPTYNRISYPSDEGWIKAKINGKYGYINTHNEVVIPFEYDKIGDFSNGRAIAVKDGKHFYINKENEIISPAATPIEPNYNFPFGKHFHNGRALIELNGKAGFINKDYELVVPAIYDNARHFRNGIARVMLNGKWGAIDINGKIIIPFKYKRLWEPENSMMKFQLFENKKE